MSSERFTRELLDAADESSRTSAAVVVPRVLGLFRPASVVDFGCGRGYWLAAFQAAGVAKVLGLDSPWVPRETLAISQHSFRATDLTAPVRFHERFDLAVCLEVAEHLPEAASEVLVDSLADASEVVLFSAAVPGQGGYGHINERPQEWWQDLFRRRGYEAVPGFAEQLRGRPDVAWWYARNILFYVRTGASNVNGARLRAALAGCSRVVPNQVAPVVLTCAAAPGYTRSFVESYLQQVAAKLPSPVVLLDLTATRRLPGDYLADLARLAPRAMHVHPQLDGASAYDSVQDAAFQALAAARQELRDDEGFILFLEDDVVFSSQFMSGLAAISSGPRVGFHTLYQPGDEYGSRVIDADRFYGTQCLLLPRSSVDLIVENRRQIELTFPPGYDIRWSRYLRSVHRTLYACEHSYVQHLGVDSRLGGQRGHVSNRFVP